MMLDIRYPIGGMFAILGSILVVFGLVSNSHIYQVHSLGVNVNLGWGCALLLFSGFMLAMTRRATLRTRRAKLSQSRGSRPEPEEASARGD
jgi:hypothetical protein